MAFANPRQTIPDPASFVKRAGEMKEQIRQFGVVLEEHAIRVANLEDLTQKTAEAEVAYNEITSKLQEIQTLTEHHTELHDHIKTELTELVNKREITVADLQEVEKHFADLDKQYADLDKKYKELDVELLRGSKKLEEQQTLINQNAEQLIKDDEALKISQENLKKIGISISSAQVDLTDLLIQLETAKKSLSDKQIELNKMNEVISEAIKELKINQQEAVRVVEEASVEATRIKAEAEAEIAKKNKELDIREANLGKEDKLVQLRIEQLKEYRTKLEAFFKVPYNKEIII